MKFLLKSLATLLILYIIIYYAIFFFNNDHKVNYNIGNFNIEEKLNNKNSYYFNIKGEKTKINFQINENLNKEEKVIKKLYYEKIDKYNCFMPIFKNSKILTDVMCLKENVVFNAHDLNNQKINQTFKKYGYDKTIYADKAKAIEMSNTQKIYQSNMPENNYIAIENYKGLTLFNSKESNVKIFDKDIYKKPISIFTDKYYVVADYNSEYTFKNFYVVNIINGQTTNIRSYDEISFDSYIEGVVDGEIYLFDKDAQKQYKINIEYESVEKVSDKDNIKHYDGKWRTITLSEALNEKKFTTYRNTKNYEKTDKINGYYYFYKKEKDKYIVYRADKQNKKLKTYLFETSDMNSIIYLKDKIYFRNGNNFNYYSKKGVRKLITNTELEFNNDISLGAYEK
ncbi:MAG: hypothetical protein IKG27_06850 [Bacilli bacterium]|nr:hypothetical protein [Bacilli bacterium]